jgi:glucose-1-phosphate thymidylyltransferase
VKGIILAGGSGTRLYPATCAISKQLLPVYDKPMIYYPLSVLMLAGIRDILIITTPQDQQQYKDLLGCGNQWGLELSYITQSTPDGLAQAFVLGAHFIGNDSVCLILGDNIFFGQGFLPILRGAVIQNVGATIFGYQVKDPQRFGIAEVDACGKVTSLEEKPTKPRSNLAVTGLYMYDNQAAEIAKTLRPSARGELEITDLNRVYLENGALTLISLGRGFAWLDTGTHGTLLQASQFVATIEERVGMKIACLEEVAFRMDYIDRNSLLRIAESYGSSEYATYLREIAQT